MPMLTLVMLMLISVQRVKVAEAAVRRLSPGCPLKGYKRWGKYNSEGSRRGISLRFNINNQNRDGKRREGVGKISKYLLVSSITGLS
jgi:hypothetical protein